MRQTSSPDETALLGFLCGEPKHGYAIHQELADAAGLGPVWRLKLSLLYAQLAKLEEKGFVSSWTEPQEGKPPRKVFQLTETGERAFLDWMRQPVSSGRSFRLEFLVKLYFARREGEAAAARLLTAQRRECLSWLATEQALKQGDEGDGREYGRLVHLFRVGQIQAMVDWLDQCRQT